MIIHSQEVVEGKELPHRVDHIQELAEEVQSDQIIAVVSSERSAEGSGEEVLYTQCIPHALLLILALGEAGHEGG